MFPAICFEEKGKQWLRIVKSWCKIRNIEMKRYILRNLMITGGTNYEALLPGGHA